MTIGGRTLLGENNSFIVNNFAVGSPRFSDIILLLDIDSTHLTMVGSMDQCSLLQMKYFQWQTLCMSMGIQIGVPLPICLKIVFSINLSHLKTSPIYRRDRIEGVCRVIFQLLFGRVSPRSFFSSVGKILCLSGNL